MSNRTRFTRLALAGVVMVGLAASSLATLNAGQVKADNTQVNKGDRDPLTPTADQQKHTRSDVETTRQIRRAIMADKSLSTDAHNIKIITQHGKGTLRGTVRTDAEKQNVQTQAGDVAGAPNVTSDVSVVPAKPRKQK